MRGRGDIGGRKMVAREPPPPLDEIADVVEVQRQVRMAGADRLRVRLAVALIAPHHLFAEQVLGDIEVHLHIEPRAEPAHFGPIDRVDADQDLLAINLVEIFDNRIGAGEDGAVGLDQDRHLARWVQCEKLGPPLPHFFELQCEVEVLLGQHKADLARRGRQGLVIQNSHMPILPAGTAAEHGRRAEAAEA